MAKRQYAHIKGELLVWARRSLRMGLEEAAERLGVPPDRLAAWESGEQKPTINQLRNVARVYRRPLAAFFLPRPPRDLHIPHDFRTVPGHPEPELSPELLTAIRLAQYHRQLAVELAEEETKAAEDLIGSSRLAMSADIVAARARETLGIGVAEQKAWRTRYDALNQWKDAAERLGILVFHFDSVEVQEARGFSLAEVPFPVIALNGRDSPNGRIFSLLHELTHLLLNQPGISDQREYRGVDSPNQRTEVFCNHVAGSILVPRDDLEQIRIVRLAGPDTRWDDDVLGRLAQEYSVSREVVLRRLLIIGKTNERFYEAKRAEYARFKDQGQTAGFLTIPMRVIRNVGQPFLRIVLNAYYRQVITSSDVSEYVGARLKHLPAIENRLFGRNLLTGGDR
jgi:Zn-dependent peptidase ImmA (M78 family)/DNA-binding XRE family transcriptional regulator